MQLYAIFGNPIKHSLSPFIHTQFSKQNGQDINYKKILVPFGKFMHYAYKFIAEGANGFNITSPFKIEGFKLAKELTINAKIAKSVNTIKLDGANIIGENTDGIGLINDLTKNLNISLKNKKILILGAGGVVRGILPALLKQQTKLIMIANRTELHATKLATEFSSYGDSCGFGLPAIKNTPVDIIINTTSSLKGQIANIAPNVANGAICYDLSYNKKSQFTQWAQQNNAKIIANGIGMLIEQAAISFEFWTGIKPNAKKVLNSKYINSFSTFYISKK